MLTIEGIIGDLLLRHNCVIVPAFGGFVAQRVGAQLDAVNGTMTPPRKAILFNRQLINNDGLLIASYAQQNSVAYNEAQQAVNDAILRWDEQLKNGQRISIDRVGFLYFDAERNLCFEQDRFYNLLMESYGLGAIHFVSASDVEAKTTHEVVTELVREALAEPSVEFDPQHIELVSDTTDKDAPIVVLKPTKKQVRIWRYAAAAAVLPIAFYAIWIPMKTDVLESGMLSLSDFNPFHKAAPAQYKEPKKGYSIPQVEKSQLQLEELPENVSVYSFQLNDNTFLPVRLRSESNRVENTAPPVETPPQTVAATQHSSGSYVIVGCFSSASNAEQLVKTLRSKGFDAKTLPGEGLIRVSAGDGAQFSQLQPKLQAEGLSGWVLK
jgi:hypothetical protein